MPATATMFKFNQREDDPLLPRNEPAPEIQAYGTNTKNSSEIIYSQTPSYQREEDENPEPERPVDSLQSTPPGSNPTPRPSTWSSSVVGFLTFAVLLAFLLVAFAGDGEVKQPHVLPGNPDRGRNLTIDERAVRILTDTPLIDGHNDLAIFIRVNYKNDIHSPEFKDKFEKSGLSQQVDLPRLKSGMYGGAFWSAFVICPNNASEDFSDAEYSSSVAHTLQQIDLIKRLQKEYLSHFSPAGTSLADMIMRFRTAKTMLGPISIEGLHQLPQSAALSTLRLYYELGVRAATLTWNCHNAFADAAMIFHADGPTTVAPYHRGGLTDAGRKVIREMNRLGMVVDISHTSYWTQKAVMSGGTSKAPVIFSHSSVWELCPHPRNVKDDILELVKETKSVVMINFTPGFVSCVSTGGDFPKFDEEHSTLQQIVRHIMYVGEKIGYDHVGIGTDYDGMGDVTPKGLDGVDKLPDLVKELLAMGVSDADVSKIVGGNVIRVWQTVEEVARNMKRGGVREGEDEVSGYSE